MQHYPYITALTAGVIVILQMTLMIMTAMARGKHKQGLGDGGKPALIAHIRSHGNLAENAPIILIILGLLEIAGTSTTVISIAAVVFVIGRILHPVGLAMSHGTTTPRVIGVLSTMLVGMFGGIFLIYTIISKI